MSKYSKKLPSKAPAPKTKKIDYYESLSNELKEVYKNSNEGSRDRDAQLFHTDLDNLFPPDQYKISLDAIRKAMVYHLKGYTVNLAKNELTWESKYTDSVNWFPSDSEELFNKHIQDENTKSLMHKSGWCDKDGNPTKFTYNLNEYGFRTENFSEETDPGILFLGCSFTFGVGLPNDETFAQKVSNNFNLKNYNLGVPGRGLDFLSFYISTFLKKQIDVEKIKAIVVFMPPPGRETIFNYHHRILSMTDVHNDILAFLNFYQNRHLDDIHPLDRDHADIDFDQLEKIESFKTLKELIKKDFGMQLDEYRSKLYEHNYFTQENNFKRDVLNINTIKCFALENNIPMVVLENNPIISGATDLARDMMHFGTGTHTNIAEKIISKLNIFLT